jgi:hypothetical protein
MATGYCFDITTARDYYDKLLVPEVDDFRRDFLSSVKGLSAAIYLWQFAEWVVGDHVAELGSVPGLSKKTKDDLRNFICGMYDGYRYVGVIATGVKHHNVTSNHLRGLVDKTEVGHGYATGLLALTQSHLVLKMSDGTTRFLDRDIFESMKAWEQFVKLYLRW